MGAIELLYRPLLSEKINKLLELISAFFFQPFLFFPFSIFFLLQMKFIAGG